MKTKRLLVAAALLAALGVAGTAQAGVTLGIGIGAPAYPYHHYYHPYYPPYRVGVYVAPAPVYYAPPPPATCTLSWGMQRPMYARLPRMRLPPRSTRRPRVPQQYYYATPATTPSAPAMSFPPQTYALTTEVVPPPPTRLTTGR